MQEQRTIKEDLVYVNEFQSVNQFRDKFDEWGIWYNQKYPHSANKYKST
ncbi:MAG: integrase core domain-containing protein [Candidatus Zixiibacteriota bacterium]